MKTLIVLLMIAIPGGHESRYLKPVTFPSQSVCEQARDAVLATAPERGGIIAKCV